MFELHVLRDHWNLDGMVKYVYDEYHIASYSP